MLNDQQEEPICGFECAEMTGIEALKNWIEETSLPQREAHCDRMLTRCATLFDAIEGWVEYDSIPRPPTKLPNAAKASTVDRLTNLTKKMDEVRYAMI